MDRLPIDSVLSQISDALQQSARVVLEAPPGAGKTTRVPWHLAECYGRVLVGEPRRLAAKLAAFRVAEEHRERPGESVGFSVRLEHVAGPTTRALYVTDGVLLNMLATDPELSKVQVVVLDEFHERRLQTDVCLALLARLQETRRPDLKLVLMSATLDADEVAAHLGGCTRVRSEGRSYESVITYQKRSDDRPLAKRVASGVRELLGATNGDLLVFLPGAREIRETQAALKQLAEAQHLFVAPLHGELPLEEQTAAVRRHRLRKVVLATNVAESSVTVDNVGAVIDSGLARQLVHDAWSQMSRLGVVKISQASAIQRAGRAGRTRDGLVLRLYTQGDFEARVKSERPEIERLDLSETLLLLKSAQIRDTSELPWLTPPPDSSLAAAEKLLDDLGATGKDGALTAVGRHLARFSVHPRLGRLIHEGEQRGIAEQACLTAALLSEREIRLKQSTVRGLSTHQGDSDMFELLDCYHEAEVQDFARAALRRLELDAGAIRQVSQTYHRLRRLSRNSVPPPSTEPEREEALLIAIMTGFIDRLAQRSAQSRSLLLTNGKVAELANESVVSRAPLLVAVSASERVVHHRRGKVLVRLASAIKEQWLFDLYIDRFTENDAFEFNQESERVERVSRLRFGRITLDETRTVAAPCEAAAAVLLKAAASKGAHAFEAKGDLPRLLARIQVLRLHTESLPSELIDQLSPDNVLAHACRDATSFKQLRERGLSAVLRAMLPARIMYDLEQMVPENLVLPSGRRLKIHYDAQQEPYVESRLQDFFGMTQTPRLCNEKLPVLLHLLAPNRRAVQVTRDLAGFWERHYPTLRRQLMRRYPKHAWPEDGKNAMPPAPRVSKPFSR